MIVIILCSTIQSSKEYCYKQVKILTTIDASDCCKVGRGTVTSSESLSLTIQKSGLAPITTDQVIVHVDVEVSYW